MQHHFFTCRFKRIKVAFLFGSLLRGGEHSGSDADVMVVGNVTFSEVVSALGRVQETIRREINPIVNPQEEFRSKLAGNHHFLKTVLEDSRFFLIGDEHELEKLAKKQLADRTPYKHTRDHLPARSSRP